MTDASAPIVYDLDGTLVRLAVDWEDAATDVLAVYEEAGVPVEEPGLWHLVDEASEHGIHEPVEAALSEHEVAGAETARRLPLADEAATWDGPVGVCSLNCEAAVETALEVHDLADHVDAVVGRDTVATQKPDPEGLLAAIDAMGAAPEATTFVGDSDSDREAAERAGVAFDWVRDRLPQRR